MNPQDPRHTRTAPGALSRRALLVLFCGLLVWGGAQPLAGKAEGGSGFVAQLASFAKGIPSDRAAWVARDQGQGLDSADPADHPAPPSPFPTVHPLPRLAIAPAFAAAPPLFPHLKQHPQAPRAPPLA